MGTRFIAVPAGASIVAELGALLPASPFATASFFESKRQVGYAAWVLGLRDAAEELKCGCGAFLKTGRLDRMLEIPSLPAEGAQSSFWAGLLDHCRHHGITKLELGTSGSPPGVEIPSLGNVCTRTSRCEFVLDLTGDLAAMLSPSHKKNVKRAQKAGLVVRRTRSAEAASAQLTLMNHSIDRRRSRGESVTMSGPSPELMAFLETGAGELFQAIRGETVLSGVLVLHAPRGAYSYYAGTSSEGMKLSASHFLNYCIASQLSAVGVHTYNLGGADQGTSLANFKEGFGASQVLLPSASCYVGPWWRRGAGRAITLIRSGRQRLLQSLAGRTSRMIVYAVDTGMVRPPEPRVGLEFRALTPEDLRGLSVEDSSFRARQLERLSRFDASYAYAVFADGQIAHVSWLLPHNAMKNDPPRVFRARASEAEITACETLPTFRGRGIYGVAIRNLVEVARGQGMRRVLMKTASENKASQLGIEKAGLKRVGSAILIVLPVIQRLVVWRRFR